MRLDPLRLSLIVGLVISAPACSGGTPPPKEEQTAVVVAPTVTPNASYAAPTSLAPAEAGADDSLAAELDQPSGPLTGLLPDSSPPRARALLQNEVSMLEQLLAATAASAADRPKILERLGKDYAELALSCMAEGSADLEKQAHEKATEHLSTLQRDYPGYAHLDEVLYLLGSELVATGNRDRARRSWLELIQKLPQSRLVPHTYLAFAEMFFEESASDPSKLQIAKQAYQEVLKYPPPDNRAYGYAQYKLGWVHYSLSEFAEALAAFRKAAEYGDQLHAGSPSAAALSREARKDMVRAYERAGVPGRAWEFMRSTNSGNAAGEERTAGLCERLGRAYLGEGKAGDAVALYEDIADHHASPAACRMLNRALGEASASSSVQPAALSRLQAKVRASCGP